MLTEGLYFMENNFQAFYDFFKVISYFYSRFLSPLNRKGVVYRKHILMFVIPMLWQFYRLQLITNIGTVECLFIRHTSSYYYS